LSTLPTSLSLICRNALLAFARRALVDLAAAITPSLRDCCGDLLDAHVGVFVTLRKAGNLRGCIGYTAADEPLSALLPQAARSAAIADPRFPPLTKAEVDHIAVEITLLGVAHEVRDIDEIVIGHHGLIVSNGTQRGLLLPQVAVEGNYDVPAFLDQTCRKAGLAIGSWRNKDTKIELFSGYHFAEVKA
jgi:AmmeMemoRadiSam system protein A